MDKTTPSKDALKTVAAVMVPLHQELKSDRKFVAILLHILTNVTDFRQQVKVKYKLENILCICLLLAMQGEFTSFYNASIFIKVRAAYFRRLKLIHGNNIPSHDTLRRIFLFLDADELRDAMLQHISLIINKITARVLKQDQDKTSLISKEGPAINGSEQKTDLRNINVFNLLDSFTSVCQTSGLLDDKEPEIPAFERILQRYNLSNTMVSADALHCQIKTLESIHQRKGMYTLTVNENQLPKQEHIKEVMRLNEKKCQSFNFNQGHYEIFLIDHKLTVDDFPHAKAYVRMLSYKRTGKPDCYPVEQYFVSSASNPEFIMAAIDSREEIVGGFDCLTDDFLKEESCTFMDKHAIKVMAVFNNR